MELALNLVWAIASIALTVIWFRLSRQQTDVVRMRGLVALCILIVLLFPVISATDDLLAINTAAESDHLLRPDEMLHAHSPVALLPSVAILGALLVLLVSGTYARRPLALAESATPNVSPGFHLAHGLRPPPVGRRR